MTSTFGSFLTMCMIVFFSFSVFAQAQSSEEPEVSWQKGPIIGDVEGLAEIKVPEGFMFGNKALTQTLLKRTGNSINGTELAVIAKENSNWFLLFEFDEIGYIKDADKEELDAEAILDSITQGTEAAEKAKQEQFPDYVPMVVEGWHTPPSYNKETKNLEWAIRAKSGDSITINHNIRVLGRKGVMKVILVASDTDLDAAVADTRNLLAGYNFTSGNKYSEFMEGDKVAAYGLGALVAGGAAAALLKTGFLQKFWKLILVGLVAAGAFLKKLLTGRLGEQKVAKKEDDSGAEG